MGKLPRRGELYQVGKGVPKALTRSIRAAARAGSACGPDCLRWTCRRFRSTLGSLSPRRAIVRGRWRRLERRGSSSCNLSNASLAPGRSGAVRSRSEAVPARSGAARARSGAARAVAVCKTWRIIQNRRDGPQRFRTVGRGRGVNNEAPPAHASLSPLFSCSYGKEAVVRIGPACVRGRRCLRRLTEASTMRRLCGEPGTGHSRPSSEREGDARVAEESRGSGVREERVPD